MWILKSIFTFKLDLILIRLMKMILFNIRIILFLDEDMLVSEYKDPSFKIWRFKKRQ